MAELPSKLFFRIGEVASLVGVEPHVLRYWEREFRSIRPTKSAKGQRVYSRRDVENLLRVRDLLYRDGFTIAGAKKQLHGARSPEAEVDAQAEALPMSVPLSETEAVPIAVTEAAPIAVLAPAVASIEQPGPESSQRDVRNKLVALRTEVEAFLQELSHERRR